MIIQKIRSAAAIDQSTSRTDPPGYDETMSNGRTESLLEESSINIGLSQSELNIADIHTNDNMLESALSANNYNSQQVNYVDENRNSFEQQLRDCLKNLQDCTNHLNHAVANKKISKYVQICYSCINKCFNGHLDNRVQRFSFIHFINMNVCIIKSGITKA